MTALSEPMLAHSLLPSHPTHTCLSHDVPSTGEVRPFGLTHTTDVPAGDLPDLSGLRYDPYRQVNVGADGRPSGPGGGMVMATSTDTRFDNQWFTDKD